MPPTHFDAEFDQIREPGPRTRTINLDSLPWADRAGARDHAGTTIRPASGGYGIDMSGYSNKGLLVTSSNSIAQKAAEVAVSGVLRRVMTPMVREISGARIGQ